ncbi:FAD-dependent monooxygenase [Mycobacterium sp. E1747]|uniref:FAD-dependent monooxygenase n=1 Tax=Mycobacterium sp. E1747 TaxID=1834128 RepID=UPI0007FC4044|nr:FAD-dependent monooxygenase [Mycobacterium sp. E1747]OBH08188.1 monooxygenase FAD-binding protein [Mycobacterium sp. E1747]
MVRWAADQTTFALVVGAGPAGLTCAAALGSYGVDHLLIERYPGTAHTPRAHIVNQRTVEIVRHLGGQQDLEAASTPHEGMANRLWVTTLTRPDVVRKETWGTEAHVNAAYRRASPATMLNCPQTRFEPVLVDIVRRQGSDVAFGHKLVETRRCDGGYLSTVRVAGGDFSYTVWSRYVIGADGARSSVLQMAGLTVQGQTGLGHAANIWFRADLSPYLAHRPAVLVSSVYPGPQPPRRGGLLICYEQFNEFVLSRFYDPTVTDLAQMSNEEAIGYIEAFVGEPVAGVQILGIADWQINNLIAPKFSNAGIFCMGDAVHRHPPTTGMGLNMSAADAFNLAWKLALVERGVAGEALLNTYNTERQPVDAATVERAVSTTVESAAFEESLGLRPGQTEEEGWAALAELDDPGPIGDARRATVRAALGVQDKLFNALGFELGYRYRDGAIVDDDHPADEPPGDPWLDYHPGTRPGARVAHARIERERVPLSTLDLIDGLQFALLVGLDDTGWRQAARQASATLSVEIVVHQIGGPEIRDPYFEWADRREVGHDGAVLVRPDRHVAWRAHHRPSDPAGALTTALRRILAR